MEQADLENCAHRMLRLERGEHDYGPARLRAERDRLHLEMSRILRTTSKKMVLRKNMGPKLREEIDQHIGIAIVKAIASWNPDIATFSTYVHWQIRAEMQTLQWTEMPERRKLQISQPIQMRELDRPMGNGINEEPGATYKDMLVDEEAADRVEGDVATYMAERGFERIMSHFVMREIRIKASRKDPELAAKKTAEIMRNYHVYWCRVYKGETFEIIASRHNLTRERIRQIVSKTQDELRRQKLAVDGGAHAQDMAAVPAEIEPQWNQQLVDYYMATGYDLRVLDHGPLPRRPEKTEDRREPTVTIEQGEPERTDNVVVLDTRRMMRPAAILALGAMTLASAANAQSRAIPPDTVQSAPAEDAAPSGIVQAPRARMKNVIAKPALQPIGALTTGGSGWGIAVARFASIDQARRAIVQEQRTWPWTQGLTAGYRKDAAGYTLAFGPLSQGQAEGMCHEARRVPTPCNVISYGTNARGG